jgi:hypothetical protein
MTKKTPNFGLVPSPEDSRDFLLSNSPAMLEIKRRPKELPILFDLPITNQGSNPSCVGHAGGTIKQFVELREKSFIRPDREWLYAECKKIDGMPNVDGTYFRAVLKVLRDKGCKLEGQDNDPSIYRIAEYRRIDDLSFNGIKNALAIWGHALGGYRGSNAGWSGEVIRKPKAGEPTWGHAITLLGYLEQYILGQNSWGEQKHNKGIFKAPENYMPFEGWVITVDRTNEPRETEKTAWIATTKWSKPQALYIGTDNITRYKMNVREEPTINSPVIKTIDAGVKVRPVSGDADALENLQEDVLADGYQWRNIFV